MVVAATNGVSAVLASDGTPVAEAEKRTTSVLLEEVTTSSRTTPAVRMGPWPGRVAILVVLVALLPRRATPSMPYARRAANEGVAG